MTDDTKGLNRRTVLQGAAWSVPVIAVAAATPLAAASGGARLTAAFVIYGDLGETTDTIAGAIFIRNTSTAAVTLDTGDVIIHVEGLESVDRDTDFMDTTFDPAAVDELGENSVPETEADNALFSAGPVSSNGEMDIVLAGSVTVAATEQLVLGFYFSWNRRNPVPHRFIIAGYVSIDYGDGVGIEQLPLDEEIVVEAAAG